MNSGIIIDTQQKDVQNYRVMSCLFNGILVFLGAYGTIGCFVSSFDIECNMLLLGMALFVLSLYTSFLYYNKITMNIGYLLLLILFLFGVLSLYKYINSGFSAVMNIMYEAADQKLGLPALKQFEEIVADRYVSITVMFLFIGCFVVIVLNCTISRSMNFLDIFLSTFLIIQLGFYFEHLPSLRWIFMLSVCWITVGILKRSQGLKAERKKRRNYGFYGPVLVYTGAYLSLFLLIVFFLIQCFIPNRMFYTPAKWNALKDSTNEPVGDFLMTGLSSLFQQDRASGGIGGGRLGEVRSLRPDFETDLKVKLVPYNYEPIYLKAYAGTVYTSHQWENDPFAYRNDYEILNREKYNLQNRNFKHQKLSFRTQMEITNVGASQDYYYQPYYSGMQFGNALVNTESMIYGTTPIGKSYKVNYYPLLDPISFGQEEKSKEIEEYDKFAAEYYVSNSGKLPVELEEKLESICAEEQFSGSQEDKIEQVVSYLGEHYKYSLTPGGTPRNQDFVLYFLNKQKKGFCVHFATTATLLFRQLGIPARYAEGYQIPFRQIADGVPDESADYNEWISGIPPIGNTGVIEAEVNDSSAHAWVEVYKEDFGWIPVEVTPASDEDDTDTKDFWTMFTRIFQGNGKDENVGNQAVNQMILYSGRVLTAGILVIAAGCAAAVFFLLFVKIGLAPIRKNRCFSQGRFSDYVLLQYKTILKLLNVSGDIKQKNLSYGEFKQLSMTYFGFTKSEADTWVGIIEKAAFSKEELNASEAAGSMLFYHQARNRCFKKKSIVKIIAMILNS